MIANMRSRSGTLISEVPLHRYDVHRVPSSLVGPVDPSFRALSGRLEFTVRRHKFNKDSLVRGWRSDASEHAEQEQDAPLTFTRVLG